MIVKIIETPRRERCIIADLGSFIVPDNKNIKITRSSHSVTLNDAWELANTIPKRKEYTCQNVLLFHHYIDRSVKRITPKMINKIISEHDDDILWWEKHLSCRISNILTHFKVLWEFSIESSMNLSNLYESQIAHIGLCIRARNLGYVKNWIRKYWILQNYEITI